MAAHNEYKSVCVYVWAEHRLEQHEFSRAWHLQICNEEGDSWLTLCPLQRPSEEDFQLLIRTVWSLCRCNFLNSISVLFLVCVCLLVICLCSRTLRSFLPVSVAPCTPLSLPSSFPGPSYFLSFPPFLPSLHKLPLPPSAFLLLFVIHSLLPSFSNSSPLSLFTVRLLGLYGILLSIFAKVSHGHYSIWIQ